MDDKKTNKKNLSSTFYLRMPYICSVGFKSGDWLGLSITFTLIFLNKAVVVLDVCLEGHCQDVIVPSSPVCEGCVSVQYFMIRVGIQDSLSKLELPMAEVMQPETKTRPPPCLTIGKTHLSLCSLCGCHNTQHLTKKGYLGLRPQDIANWTFLFIISSSFVQRSIKHFGWKGFFRPMRCRLTRN